MELIPIAPSGADADDEQAEKADDEKWPREHGKMHRGREWYPADEVKNKFSLAVYFGHPDNNARPFSHPNARKKTKEIVKGKASQLRNFRTREMKMVLRIFIYVTKVGRIRATGYSGRKKDEIARITVACSYNKLDIISCLAHNSSYALVMSGGRSVGGRGSRGG